MCVHVYGVTCLYSNTYFRAALLQTASMILADMFWQPLVSNGARSLVAHFLFLVAQKDLAVGVRRAEHRVARELPARDGTDS